MSENALSIDQNLTNQITIMVNIETWEALEAISKTMNKNQEIVNKIGEANFSNLIRHALSDRIQGAMKSFILSAATGDMEKEDFKKVMKFMEMLTTDSDGS